MLARLTPAARIVAVLAFVVIVVGAPPEPVRLSVAAVVAIAMLVDQRPSWSWLAGRTMLLVPFLALAVLMAFIAAGPRCVVGPLTLSCSGGMAAAVLVARCLISFGAVLALTHATRAAEIAEGLTVLRLPSAMVVVINLLIRYLHVLAGDVERQAVARASRGDGRRILGRWVAAASGIGRLFIRGYERGERVHLAMVSRGFDGTMPVIGVSTARWQWAVALAPATVVAVVGVLG